MLSFFSCRTQPYNESVSLEGLLQIIKNQLVFESPVIVIQHPNPSGHLGIQRV